MSYQTENTYPILLNEYFIRDHSALLDGGYSVWVRVWVRYFKTYALEIKIADFSDRLSAQELCEERRIGAHNDVR